MTFIWSCKIIILKKILRLAILQIVSKSISCYRLVGRKLQKLSFFHVNVSKTNSNLMETTAADFNSVSGFMSLIFYIETILAYQQRQANKFLCLPIIFFLQYNIPVSRTMRTKLFTEIFHSHSDIHLFIYFVSWKDTISELKYNMKSMVKNFKLVSWKTKGNQFYFI